MLENDLISTGRIVLPNWGVCAIQCLKSGPNVIPGVPTPELIRTDTPSRMFVISAFVSPSIQNNRTNAIATRSLRGLVP